MFLNTKLITIYCGNFSKYLKFTLEFTPEQCQAVNSLLQGSNIIAVLLTEYAGKSLIFFNFLLPRLDLKGINIKPC